MWEFSEVWDSIIKYYAGCSTHSKQQKLQTARVRHGNCQLVVEICVAYYGTPNIQTVLTYMHVNIECRDNDEHLPEVLRIVLGLHLT